MCVRLHGWIGRYRIRAMVAGGCLVLASLITSGFLAAFPSPQGLTVFEAPGAGTDAAQGTSPQGINDAGDIVGQYIDSEGAAHGFMRSKNGMFTAIDVPGASRKSMEGTFPRSINKRAELAGYFELGSNDARHGFVRHQDGSFATFDPPGSLSTVAQSINEKGDVTGNYVADDAAHGFVLRADGTFLLFDPPGSYNTAPQVINGSGDITGSFEDVIGVLRGFIRHADGSFDTFSVPNASQEKGQGTYPMSMNEKGEIVGYYNAGPYRATHAFLRRKNGTIVTLEPPGSITDSAAHQDEEGYVVRPVTAPTGINDDGEIVGYYGDSTGVLHGFVRTNDGSFRNFDAPGASKHSDLGTSPMGINNAGQVTGYYYADPDETLHAFILTQNAAPIPKTTRAKKNPIKVN